MEVTKMSWTRACDYKKCKACWYAQYVLKYPKPHIDSFDIGGAVHAGIAAFRVGKTLDESIKIAKAETRPEFEDVVQFGVIKACEAFGKEKYILVESWIEAYRDGVKIIGRIDAAREVRNLGLVVCDLKTTRAKNPSYGGRGTKRQLALYAWIMEQQMKKPCNFGQIHGIDLTTGYPTKVNVPLDNKLKVEALEVIENAITGIRNDDFEQQWTYSHMFKHD